MLKASKVLRHLEGGLTVVSRWSAESGFEEFCINNNIAIAHPLRYGINRPRLSNPRFIRASPVEDNFRPD
jgi:hypothetical protein